MILDQNIRSPHTDRTWECIDKLLVVSTGQSLSAPHKSYYDVTTTGWTLNVIVKPGVGFKISKKVVAGFSLEYQAPNLVFSLSSPTATVTVSHPISTAKLSRVTCYVTTAGKLGIYTDGRTYAKIESASTITGDFTNTATLDIAASCSIAMLSLFDKQLSNTESDYMQGKIGIITTTTGATHMANCVGFWPMQEPYGDKAYGCVEQFNRAKGADLVANHFTLSGYTATQLGTTDKTTQTARVNLYDKTTTLFWQASGTEKGTGLPELKKYLPFTASSYIRIPFTIPASVHEMTVFISFYNDGVSNGQYPWHFELNSGLSTNQLQVRLNWGSVGSANWWFGGGQVVSNILLKKGINTLTVIYRDSGISPSYMLNGHICAGPNQSMTSKETLERVVIGVGCNLINFGVNFNRMDRKDIYDLSNNTLLKNPKKSILANLPLYFNASSTITGTSIPNFGTNGGNGTILGTVPTAADISTLR